MSTPLIFDERLQVTGQLVGRARLFLDVWWFYEGAGTRPAIIDTMNEYSEFLRFDGHAHFVAAVVHLAGLLETRGDTVNLRALVDAAVTNCLAAATIAEAEGILAEMQALRPKVMVLRNNLFAHRSASISYAAAFRIAAITPNEFRKLTESAPSPRKRAAPRATSTRRIVQRVAAAGHRGAGQCAWQGASHLTPASSGHAARAPRAADAERSAARNLGSDGLPGL